MEAWIGMVSSLSFTRVKIQSGIFQEIPNWCDLQQYNLYCFQEKAAAGLLAKTENKDSINFTKMGTFSTTKRELITTI